MLMKPMLMKKVAGLPIGIVGFMTASWLGGQLWFTLESVRAQLPDQTDLTKTHLIFQQAQTLALQQSEVQAQDGSKQGLELHKEIQDEVDRTFNHTTALLNVLLAILTVMPIIATVLLFLTRQMAIQQLQEQIREQVHQEIDTQISAELKQQSLQIKEQMQQQAKELQDEIDQLRDEIKHQMINVRKSATEFEQEKFRIFQEITSITVLSSSKDVLSPDNKQRIKSLTQQLDDLKSKSNRLELGISECIREGDALFFSGRYEEAITVYNRAIDKAMTNQADLFAAWHGKTKSFRRLKQYSLALEASTRAMELRPDDALMWFERGYLLQLQGQYSEALNAYDRVIITKPDYHRVRNHRGYILLKLKRYNEALAELERGIELKPDYGNGYYGKAYYHLLHQQPEFAINDLKAAIERYPKYKTQVKTDPDFASLWDDSRFHELVGDRGSTESD